MQFLSDEWLTALADVAATRARPADDPLETVRFTVEQVVSDGPSWRLVIDRGEVRVESAGAGDADLRLTSDRETATAIAAGRRAALDAFIAGDLTIGGDVRPMLEHRAALETIGDLFARLRDSTSFDPPLSS